MKRLIFATALLTAAALIATDELSRNGQVSAAVADENSYFDSLARRADAWKVYSLRDAAQLASRTLGGYANGASDKALWVTYSPDTDTDRHRQDAAKVMVPAFNETTTLTKAVNSSETVLTLADAYKPLYPTGRVMKVDREVMVVTGYISSTTVSVQRGAYSSVPASHASGATLMHATNSLPNQVRLPLGTEDGHSYFFTWDGYWTDSFLGAGDFNHKAFQFSSGGQGGDSIWLEPDVAYFGDNNSCWNSAKHVATFHVRSYNHVGGVANWLLTDGHALGPIVSRDSPLAPRTDFCMEPNKWVRFFMNIKQRRDDYDYVDMWLADESRDPVQVLFNVPVSVQPDGSNPHTILKFWLEFNSSTDDYMRPDGRDLVAYVRNFVALRDTADILPLLIRPTPGAQAAAGPGAPTNVRIIR